jgi:glutathione S-transferase
VVWLMDDLTERYNLVAYVRTNDFHTPDSLTKVHLPGKSPVICDEGVNLAEPSTTLRHLVEKFSDTSNALR